jgi:hypothetical protein
LFAYVVQYHHIIDINIIPRKALFYNYHIGAAFQNSVTIASAPRFVVCAVAVCVPFFKSCKSLAKSARLALCPLI